jgi:BMFP domain-containing protein YqiC
MQELYAERDGLMGVLVNTGDPKERAAIEKRIAELNAKLEPKPAKKAKKKR